MRSYARQERRSVEIDGALGLLEPSPAFLPHPARTPWCGSSTGKQRPRCAFPAPSPRAVPRCAHPAVPRRYLLCELVSEDPRCRLSLDDRVLGGLVRDTIARVHGAFGAAACSVGFAGARAPQVGCGARFAGGRPGPCAAFCTRAEGSRKARVRRVQNRAENAGHAMMGRGKKFNTQPGCVPEGVYCPY